MHYFAWVRFSSADFFLFLPFSNFLKSLIASGSSDDQKNVHEEVDDVEIWRERKRTLNFNLLTTTLRQSQADFIKKWTAQIYLINESCPKTAVSNTAANSHMWLLAFQFVAILKKLNLKITLLIKILRQICFQFVERY